MKGWLLWVGTQDKAFQFVFNNVVASAFKFGGRQLKIFGADTANFVWCRGGAQAIRVPVVGGPVVSWIYGNAAHLLLPACTAWN